jgi:hypothetical protein
MAPTNDEDYGQFIYLDIEDYIEEYDCNNRPIYCKVGSKNYIHSRYASTDKWAYLEDYENNYWLENIKTNAIGLFVVGITIYMIL